MPGIISALRDHANPFSILTNGTLILRDLDLLVQASEVTDVGISVSVGFTDPALWRTVEPGTPAPERRLNGSWPGCRSTTRIWCAATSGCTPRGRPVADAAPAV